MAQHRWSKKLLPNFSPAVSQTLFCLVWLAGLICGGIIATQASEPYLLLMRRAAQVPVSITGLLAAVFLPFLLIAISVYISKPWLIYWIVFFKACTFMIVGFSVASVYGSAGWLIRLLLQFTDGIMLPMLCWFACRHLNGGKDGLWRDTVICAVAVVCLGCIDYCNVSPFLALLIENSQMGR
jgi:hypothetical protein